MVRKLVQGGRAEISVSLRHARGAHLRDQQDRTVVLKKEYNGNMKKEFRVEGAKKFQGKKYSFGSKNSLTIYVHI